MRKKLTSIGNSRAVILPKELLELYGFGDEIELLPTEGGLILRPAKAALSFEDAADKLFSEKDALLERLSNT